ncbi:unnamed protein product [Caenorhabditis angaria]|uniref:Uncharacterized protein n=1 Tax=Caenorhabditis angaria TaxID=860376 RepID=A0A9P1MVR9_9PELO|nr:unnamed protein product [Caenorhabditis angaria]
MDSIQMTTMKMLPEETSDDDQSQSHPQFSEERPTSSLQSSISKRTRKGLKDFSENVQNRLQGGGSAQLQRIKEDESPSTPSAPPRPNRQIYRNSIDCVSIVDETKQQRSSDQSSEASSESHRSNWSQSVQQIENALNRNYYKIAYSIVIIAYLAGFAEYMYFRLVSLIIPEHIVFHPPCEGKSNRKIGKEGFHYGISICAFIGVSIFQLLCFFGLTISENWTESKENPRESRQAAHREEFALYVRTMISKTMYRVFLCYAICSLINCAIIFYMVAIQDSLGDIVSTILLYVFDAVVILYFIAFPLTTIIYHPYVHCFRNRSSPPARFRITGDSLNPRTQTSTLESNISGLDEALPPVHQIPPEIPKLNFSRQDPNRIVLPQRRNEPIFEEYLHSPRRHNPQTPVSVATSKSTTNSERLTTFV